MSDKNLEYVISRETHTRVGEVLKPKQEGGPTIILVDDPSRYLENLYNKLSSKR